MRQLDGGVSSYAFRTGRVALFALVLGLLSAPFFFGSARAVYTPPPESFITDPSEQRVTLTITSGSIASVQGQIDRARSANPNAVIVVRLSGTYEVDDAPLSLPAKTCLVLSGTIRAAAGASAGALVSIDGRSRVSISGGTFAGGGAGLSGIRVAGASGVNIDGVTVTHTGLPGISFTGPGSTVWDAGSTITRAEVSGSSAAGIKVLSATTPPAAPTTWRSTAGCSAEASTSSSREAQPSPRRTSAASGSAPATMSSASP